MEQIITIIALIASIIIHEMSHGYAANALGDPTARLQGRLSGNPLVHIDPLGSVILPALLYFSHAGFVFGWAKPVPYNPYNLSNQRWGEALVALAGPASNFLLAAIFAAIVRLAPMFDLSQSFVAIAWYVVYINVLLGFFNLIPVPPLDGSKILMAILPPRLQMQYRRFVQFSEQYGMFVMFGFIFLFMTLFSHPFFVFVSTIVGLITGTGAF
jgi:Zn-dependent protease